ncbi:hypothetical protein CPH92_06170 [Malaciobacter marinus]|uniref:WHIM1 domain-containing protein n=1 Tax=Malaciobacter marinus TaxID=505249 RepID=A0ABX4LZ47_9BACT|nr:hypothetical protein CPH92_06170 [Malaciobacter marinus]
MESRLYLLKILINWLMSYTKLTINL